MIILFYAAVTIAFIVFQTIVRPAVPFLSGIYNPLIPFVVYLAIFRPAREAIPVTLCLGVVMDALSAGPFGLYLTTYLWLFVGIKWMVGYLRVSNTLLLPLVVVAGVLIENLVFLGAIFFLMSRSHLPDDTAVKVSEQLLWAFCTGMIPVALLDYFWKKWDGWYTVRVVSRRVEEVQPALRRRT